jgi:hypothetical protein
MLAVLMAAVMAVVLMAAVLGGAARVLLPNFFKLKYYVGIRRVHEKVERRLA